MELKTPNNFIYIYILILTYRKCKYFILIATMQIYNYL